jgi:hypothetical protein
MSFSGLEHLVLATAAGFFLRYEGPRFSLSELSVERLELCATRLAELAEKIDRSVIRHVFGTKYVSRILRAINSALSTTFGEDRMRILPTLA